MAAYESTVFSAAEASEILSLVIQHPNYVEGITDALPTGGMISVYLARALKQEKLSDGPPPRFDVNFFGSLLRKIVDSHHLDREDPAIEKKAQLLLRQASSL